MANGDVNAGATWWLALLKAMGPTACIALGLVYWMTQDLTPVLEHMNTFMDAHAAQMQQVISQQKSDDATQEKQWQLIAGMQAQTHRDREASFQIEQQVCINAAKSTFQANKCLDARNTAEQGGSAAVEP